ncbi:hypothetical protein PWT90_08863 [Aphanocladium album]|nr:hypothetical protein PWT90_08863 [Aphanocladium album]
MHSYSKIGGSSDFASRYPTRILVGYWLYSSEPDPDQHAVYGILSRADRQPFKPPSPRVRGHRLPNDRPPSSSFRAANVKLDGEENNSIDRLPPLKGFHAATANGLDEQQDQRLPPLHATLAADAMDLDDKERLPPIHSIAPPKPARQSLPQHPYGSPPAPRKALPTSAIHRKSMSTGDRTIVVTSPPTGDDDDDDDDEPRSRIFNGVTYVRKTHGSFKGKLVSPGKIITIEGQDYVEYCVLAKLSFI